MSSPDQTALRSRIEVENSLLNSRTTIFLATNGLWLAVFSAKALGNLNTAIAVVGLVVSIVWFICGRQSRNVIAALTKEHLDKFPDDPIEKLVRDALWRPGWRSPTDLLGWELPLAFIATWFLFFFWEIFSFLCLSGRLG